MKVASVSQRRIFKSLGFLQQGRSKALLNLWQPIPGCVIVCTTKMLQEVLLPSLRVSARAERITKSGSGSRFHPFFLGQEMSRDLHEETDCVSAQKVGEPHLRARTWRGLKEEVFCFRFWFSCLFTRSVWTICNLR